MIKKYLITITMAIIFTGFAIPYVFNQGRLYNLVNQHLMEAFTIAVPFNEKYESLEAKYKDPNSDYYLLNYMRFFDHLVMADQVPEETDVGEFLRKLNALLMASPDLISYENKKAFYSNLWQCRILNNQQQYKIPNAEQLLTRYKQSPYVDKLAYNFTAQQAERAWQNLRCDSTLLEDD